MGSRYNRNSYNSAPPPQQYSGSGSSSGPYTLQCDGASKGNPGRAGAGAVLRDPSGNVVFRSSQGLGNTTNNVAEYEALKLGMDHAIRSGCTDIRVQTDSKLVSQQVQGEWKVRSDNLIPLNKDVQNMKNNFNSFDIQYVPRGMNSDADSLANAGVNLREGEIQTEYYRDGRRY